MQSIQDFYDLINQHWSLGFIVIIYHAVASHGGYKGIWKNFSSGYDKPKEPEKPNN
jgi:hypothetical protein